MEMTKLMGKNGIEKKSVLIVAYVYLGNRGGLGQVVNSQVNYLTQIGFSVNTLTTKSSESKDLLKHFWFRFKALLNCRKYDIVIAHGSEGALIARFKYLFSNFGIKLPFLVTFTHGLESRLPSKSRNWKRAVRNFQILWSIKYCNLIYVMSSEDKDWIEKKFFNAPPVKIFLNSISNNFADVNYAQRIQPNYSILFVGTFIDRKGIDIVLSAFDKIKSIEERATLTLVGTPIDFLRNSESIRITHAITENELIQLYISHDMLWMPSRFEGLPLTLLEAMACGMIIISSNCCGMKDIVDHSNNGFLIYPKTHELVDITMHIWKRWSEMDIIKRSAYIKVRTWTWDDSWGKMVDDIFRYKNSYL